MASEESQTAGKAAYVLTLNAEKSPKAGDDIKGNLQQQEHNVASKPKAASNARGKGGLKRDLASPLQTEIERTKAEDTDLTQTEMAERWIRNAGTAKAPMPMRPQELFTFEREKVQKQLIVTSTGPGVTDDAIERIKDRIVRRNQSSFAYKQKLALLLRFTTTIMLAFSAVELVALFFVLLYFTVRSLPAKHTLIWVTIGTCLALGHLCLVIRSYTAASLQDKQLIQEHHCTIVRNLICYGLAAVGLLCVFCVPVLGMAEGLDEVQTQLLHKTKVAFFVLTLMKLVFQTVLLVMVRHILACYTIAEGRCDQSIIALPVSPTIPATSRSFFS